MRTKIHTYPSGRRVARRINEYGTVVESREIPRVRMTKTRRRLMNKKRRLML